MIKKREEYHFLLIILFFIFLHGCYPALKEEVQYPEQALIPIDYGYPEFEDDLDFRSLEQALRRNIEYLDRLDPEYKFVYGPHTYTCRQVRESQETILAVIQNNPDLNKLKTIIRKEFRIYRAAGRVGNRKVLYTGYFEPLYEASLTADEQYKYPIYRLPDDLVKIDLSLFRKDLSGEMIVARIEGKNVLPYFSREEIELKNVLESRALEIAWLKDPVDVAFLHIQGSGRLQLPNGETICVGYHASNGRPYQSIGRYLIDKGYLTEEEMSMQRIREYLSLNPEIVDNVLNHNPSYIFFRILEGEPLGNISVPLTAGRSIALDDKLFPKGGLCFISSEKPVVEEGRIKEWIPFSRFTLNQDTGGAINGSGRADIFWGNGPYAEMAAGHMKHEGELYMLIKKFPLEP